MGALVQFGVELESTTCHNCGIEYAMPRNKIRWHREHGGTFYCPNGHGEAFSESEVQKLKKQLETERQLRATRERWLENEQSAHRATKGQLTKVKRRVSGGACPCCKRSFVKLAQHMKTKHPDYAEAKS